MGLFSAFFSGWLLIALFMTALYFFQVAKKEADIVDVGWALAIGFLAIYYAAIIPGYQPRQWLLAGMAGFWSLRLGGYLLLNRALKPGEDGRYAALRKSWAENAQRNFFIFFQAQGFLAVILSIPFLVVMSKLEPSFSLYDVFAGMLWVVALGGEILSDLQLASFRADPANQGKTCQIGLWRYSRHPNYFFEWLHWLSYILLAVNAGGFVFAFVSPILMLYLILKVTGIPPTEARALETRGDEYRRYQATTSAFFPWFPRKI